MFDHRTVAMIVLSLLVASPALVFADAGQFRVDVLPHSGEYQLTSITASTIEAVPAVPHNNVTDELGLWERLDGVDFPVGGRDQFTRVNPHPNGSWAF
jgi:hypothetical protein